MKNDEIRSEIERLIHLIAIESGQCVESIQWEHEPIQITQVKLALTKIEKYLNELKEILGE